jgi:hypothetical protein
MAPQRTLEGQDLRFEWRLGLDADARDAKVHGKLERLRFSRSPVIARQSSP